MGVAGCGKSSVGAALARRLGAVYVDGDDLHPAANVAKMAAGIPLDDADRAPWLRRVGETLAEAGAPTFVGCSALQRKYRDILREVAGDALVFVHLSGTREVIHARMAARSGHFMPLALLDSQFAALEPLAADERGFDIDIDRPLDDIVRLAESKLRGEYAWV